MQCSRCRHESPADARFCGECGAPLGRLCVSCRRSSPPDSGYCTQCGAALPPLARPDTQPEPHTYTPKYLAERILRSREALEGERKQITVLFADLRGSLELLADRDPEDARSLLDPVLDRMIAAVHRFEGTVNQVMGDGIMALFGAPLAHEDHAVRACYAALRMQQSIAALAEELRQRQGIGVEIRIGLNSGEVVVRSIGSDLRMEYTAVGQTVHRAARMEQLATPGHIFLTESTLRLAEGYVDVKPLGLIPIKGLAEPVEVFELTGPGPIRSRLQLAAARGLTRFVGREIELAELRAALARADDGRGQVVALVGEPGVGKSRLVREFTARLPAGWRLLEAFATPLTSGAAYRPFVSLLRAYVGIEDGDEPRRVREKVTAALLELDPSLLAVLAPLLALLDVAVDDPAWQGLDPRQQRRRTHDAICRVLLRESRRHGVCLVIEDLHWLDSEAHAVLDALVDSLPTARLLLLVTYRPEYEQTWSRRSYHSQVEVHPLPRGMADELLRELVGEAADVAGLRADLVERTEGNPFFLEESVRHLVDVGALAGERGAYHLVRKHVSFEVPATVQAVIAARIDRLSHEDKRVLQCAAVIGKDVPFPLVHAIVDTAEDELRRSLAHLQAGEFLYAASLFPVLEYTFRHALTLDVAYGELLQERRHALDARIVDALEAEAGERGAEQIERLAHHAYRGGVWNKAVTYCREAGARAFARSAHRAAAQYFEQAIHALQRLPETPDTVGQAIDLRLDIRYSLSPIGDFPRMLDYLTEAEKLAEDLGDRRRLGLVVSFLSNYFNVMLDLERAVGYGERAVAIAAETQDTTVAVLANTFLGLARYSTGEFPAAIELARRNVGLLGGPLARERFGMALLPAVYSRTVLVWSLAELGHFADGIEVGHESIRIAEAADHPYSLVFSCIGLGTVYLRKGEFEDAIRYLERAVQTCRTRDVPVAFTVSASPLASAYCLAGRPQAALEILKEGVDQAIAIGDPFGHWLRTGGRAEAYLHAGRAAEALPLARRGVEITRLVKGRGLIVLALRLTGEAAAAQTPPLVEESEAAYRRALGMAEEMGMRPLEARCRLSLGALYRRVGRLDEARAELERSLEMLRPLGMSTWQGQAESELAKLR
jgi:class 3 adenylate cyclase/tetratricopeptide (TPR) repeat protein